MPTLWIHKPHTIKSFPLTYMFFNGIPLNHRNLFFFSILKQTQHLIEITILTSLKMGSIRGIFKAQTSLNLRFTSISKVSLSFFGIRNMHIFNNNRVKVFKRFKNLRNCVTILRCNSCQFRVLQLASLPTHVTRFKYIKTNRLNKSKGFS